jgi:hypothetical protein
MTFDNLRGELDELTTIINPAERLLGEERNGNVSMHSWTADETFARPVAVRQRSKSLAIVCECAESAHKRRKQA